MTSTDDTTQPASAGDTYEPAPFLRITSTTAGDDGRCDTITVELTLGDDEELGVEDPGEPHATRSWLIDLVSATVREMRGTGRPPAVVVSGAALHTALAGHVQHADGCDGTCGLPDRPPPGAEPLGHPDSDRWTGGDRKDAV